MMHHFLDNRMPYFTLLMCGNCIKVKEAKMIHINFS